MKKPIGRRKFLQISSASAGLGLGVMGNVPGVCGNRAPDRENTFTPDKSIGGGEPSGKPLSDPGNKEQTWEAKELWEQSTSQGLTCRDGAIVLDDHILIEDDAAGIGTVYEASWEKISSEVVLRKRLTINRWPVREILLTMLVYPLQPKEPNSGGKLKIHVNGHGPIIHELRHVWASIPVLPEYIKLGENIIDVTVQDKNTQFRMPLALYSNFQYGSGLSKPAFFRSEKSTDGGNSWTSDGLGAGNDQKGEFPIRIKLRAYQESGWLQTPAIALATPIQDGILQEAATIASSRFNLDSEIKMGSGLQISLRSGSTHKPEAGGWTDWELLSNHAIPSDLRDRFIQLKLTFSSEGGDISPRLLGLRVFSLTTAGENKYSPEVYVTELINHPVVPSSFALEYEDPTHPGLKELRLSHNLDKIVEPGRTELEKIILLRNWVAGAWDWFMPSSERTPFTHWDARKILNPVGGGNDTDKPGGYCLQYAIVFAQACQSFGFPARIVNANFSVYGGHEITEVWSRAYGKWIMMDPNFDTMFVYRKNGIPLNVLELHHIFLDTYYPGGEIVDRDTWTYEDRDHRSQNIDPADLPIRLQIGGHALSGELKEYVWWKVTDPPAPGYAGGYGFFNTANIRWLPRNNWLSKPGPLPIDHGRTHWGWDGYLAWTDPQTPETPEHRHFVRRERDIYPRLFSVDFHAEVVGQGMIRLSMATETPGFAHFELIDNGKPNIVMSNIYLWELSPGLNILELRSVDVHGNNGTMSKLSLNYI